MTSRDKIEFALRSAEIAERVLSMTRVAGKLHAQLIMRDVVPLIKELNDKINAMEEDK